MAVQLRIPFFSIGDQVSVTAIPEAYYAQKGERLFYSDERMWVFKHNPYIDFRSAAQGDTEVMVIPDARDEKHARRYEKQYNSDTFGSQTEYILHQLGLKGGACRHPRLYIHEEVHIVPHKVVVHTTGSDRALTGEAPIRYQFGEDEVRVMSDDVIAAIRRNYRNWLVVQIGSKSDKPLEGRNVIDLRGKLDLWESAAEIATASRFIGVNSGPMHIANCYPRVAKRIVLMEFSRSYLAHEGDWPFPWRAGCTRNFLTAWLDPENTYFNRFDVDCGSSFSYLKV
ncbi:hypothetical protein [Paraburkholderia unamae]|uniref:Glycosyl transferase family 9 (Putative heptosyltransferase) n=1 Tax=Paraburkholderia unamae TaxID=219649 RepID=A0ABX5KAC8_9BURK|nr:hypothetical protein [Paraburkholderia unamae]PVX70837.1 glycosyl transferase family 9 (putative heptosyltransferase) [Paraburkholderia unamae]